MVIKQIIYTAINLLRTIFAYNIADMLNFFELLNTLFSSYLVVLLIQILPIFYGGLLLETNE
jgi:hypothetical protein